MIKIGIIGYGYWGPNVTRNFNSLKTAKILMICDMNPDARKRAEMACPDIKIVSDYNEVINSPDIDAVAVVTPVFTHYEIAKEALLSGKHIFVEKPFTSKVSEAEELINLADKKNLKIMVDHTFLFTSAVRKIKECIDNDVLGRIYYYDSTRVNLGLFQHDINVIWDLAPHDLAILDYLFQEKPAALIATGAEHFGRNLEDVAYITLYFESNMIAHFNVNWLTPVKVRMTLIGGDKKMLVWNDLEVDEKIKIYDKGVEITTKEGVYSLLTKYRSGDCWIPKIDQIEALSSETEYFIDCILNNKTPINDGYAGLRVVKILEATNESLKNKSRLIELK
ncbi:TPA: oxidoreductase [bacterium]|nr:oxidoreductase [bacterium]